MDIFLIRGVTMLSAALVLLLAGHFGLGIPAWRNHGVGWGIAVICVPVFAFYYFYRKGWESVHFFPMTLYLSGYLLLRLWFSDVRVF